jgi:hypothetical protein
LADATIISELTPHRRFVLVSQTLWIHYWQRWRTIDREWRSGFPKESIGTVCYAIAAARDDLRAEIRALASKWPPNEDGAYLIPV